MLRTFAMLILGFTVLFAYSAGPPNQKTGRPGEGTCADCHSGTASGDSSMLTGLPGSTYVPDTDYALTLFLNYAGQVRWGFELTAVTDGGAAAGEFFLIESTATQIASAGGLEYFKQTSSGTRHLLPDTASWRLGWRAPPAGTGPVTFYWCGNATDNSHSTSGDFAIPSSLVVEEGAGFEEDAGRRRFHWYYANPGRNRVVIRYSGNVEKPVGVYSSEGRLVRALSPVAEGEGLRVDWDGTDRSGEPVPEASYFVRVAPDSDGAVKVEIVR